MHRRKCSFSSSSRKIAEIVSRSAALTILFTVGALPLVQNALAQDRPDEKPAVGAPAVPTAEPGTGAPTVVIPLPPSANTAAGEAPPPIRIPPPPELPPAMMPVLPPGTTTPVPLNSPITMDQAIAIGLAHQPSVGLARQSVYAAAGRTGQAQSALLPSLSIAAGATRSDSSGGAAGGARFGPNPADSYNESINLRQLLFDFSHSQSSVDAARAQEAAARFGETRSRNDAVLAIQQAFFTLLQDSRLTSVAQQAVDAQRAHLGDATARVGAGRASQVDLYRAQTSLAESLLQLSIAQNNEQLARTSLNLAMGIDPRTPIQVADVGAPGTTPPDLNALVSQAEEQRPDLLQALQTVAASEATLRSVRTENYPSIAATGSMGLRGGGFPGDSNSKSAGVALSWNLFDAGLTPGRVREAQANLSSVKLQLYQVQQSVISDVTQAYVTLLGDEARLTTSEAEAANARETLNFAEGRYRAGFGTFLEITDAQSALTTAQANLVNSTYALASAHAALDRAVGRPVAGQGGTVSAPGAGRTAPAPIAAPQAPPGTGSTGGGPMVRPGGAVTVPGATIPSSGVSPAAPGQLP